MFSYLAHPGVRIGYVPVLVIHKQFDVFSNNNYYATITSVLDEQENKNLLHEMDCVSF